MIAKEHFKSLCPGLYKMKNSDSFPYIWNTCNISKQINIYTCTIYVTILGTPFFLRIEICCNTRLPVWCYTIQGWSHFTGFRGKNFFSLFVLLRLVFQKCGTNTASLWLNFDPFRWGFIRLFLFPLGEPLHHQVTAWGRLGLPVVRKERYTQSSVQSSKLLAKSDVIYRFIREW